MADEPQSEPEPEPMSDIRIGVGADGDVHVLFGQLLQSFAVTPAVARAIATQLTNAALLADKKGAKQ